MKVLVYAEHTHNAGRECFDASQEGTDDVLTFDERPGGLVALARAAETGDAFERRVSETLKGAIVRAAFG